MTDIFDLVERGERLLGHLRDLDNREQELDLLRSPFIPFRTDDGVLECFAEERRSLIGFSPGRPCHVKLPDLLLRPDLYGSWPNWICRVYGVDDSTLESVVNYRAYLVTSAGTIGDRKCAIGEVIELDEVAESDDDIRLEIGARALQTYLQSIPEDGINVPLREELAELGVSAHSSFITRMPIVLPGDSEALREGYANLFEAIEKFDYLWTNNAANLLIHKSLRAVSSAVETLFLGSLGLRGG